MAARLKERYLKEIRPALVQEFGYRNAMQAPRLDKVVVNMGLGEAISNGKILDASVEQLSVMSLGRPPGAHRPHRQSLGQAVFPPYQRRLVPLLPRERGFGGPALGGNGLRRTVLFLSGPRPVL